MPRMWQRRERGDDDFLVRRPGPVVPGRCVGDRGRELVTVLCPDTGVGRFFDAGLRKAGKGVGAGQKGMDSVVKGIRDTEAAGHGMWPEERRKRFPGIMEAAGFFWQGGFPFRMTGTGPGPAGEDGESPEPAGERMVFFVSGE